MNRKFSSESRDSKTKLENISKENTNNDLGKRKNSKSIGYSLFINNLVKSKKFKSLEKRKKKESIEEQEKKKPKKSTYMEKFQRSSKPKETFKSTTKNPKINEILRQLRENEEKANASGNSNINVGKIDSNKINQFLGSKSNRGNKEENNIFQSKVKDYVDKLNKKIGEKNSSEKSEKKQVVKIKRNLKEKEFDKDNEEEEEESSSSSSSEDEHEEIRKDEEIKNIQLIEESGNNFYYFGKDQGKYVNKINNIIYTRFSFKSIRLNDKKDSEKEKSNSKEYLPKNQVSFSILSENTTQNKKANAYSNYINSIKLHHMKFNKTKIKRKKTSEDTNESEGNEKVKLYDIVGYDNKKKRMSILDILKKRNISIISEGPFNVNRTRNKSIKLVNKNINREMNIIEEEPKNEIHQYNDMVKYMVYTSITTIKKNKRFNLKDFAISKIANIELTNKETQKVIKNKANNLMIIEKKNDIEIMGKKRSGSNSIHKLRNSLQKKGNDNKIMNNNSISLINKRTSKMVPNLRASLNKSKDNKQKLNNSLIINKHTLQNRMSLKKTNKSVERRHIKSSILFDSNSSSSEEEKKEEKKEININPRKPNNTQYDELFHNFATGYSTENKPKRVSKNKIEENNESINLKYNNLRKNNALKNKFENKNIYTDRETNESRALFKQKLKTSNILPKEEILSKNEIHKVKMNKAKIRKFKSKNNLDQKQTTSGIKKNNNLNNKKYADKAAKIRQFHKQRNINSDYINNSNIILQNTTVNHTTYNYYLNDNERLSSNKKNKSFRNKK